MIAKPTYLALSALGLRGTLALPRGIFGVAPCSSSVTYEILSEVAIEGDPVTGSKKCSGSDNCVLTEQSTYSVGVTVTVGASRGLSFQDIVGAGVEASVLTIETTETAQGSEVECPDGEWTCALAIWPGMVEVKGTKSQFDTYTCEDGAKEDFTVRFPAKGANNIPPSRIEPCACKDFEHWAYSGAPQPCPQDCIKLDG